MRALILHVRGGFFGLDTGRSMAVTKKFVDFRHGV